MTLPFPISPSRVLGGLIMTSNGSPALICLTKTGLNPVVTFSVFPVECSNSEPILSNTVAIAREVKILISAAAALDVIMIARIRADSAVNVLAIGCSFRSLPRLDRARQSFVIGRALQEAGRWRHFCKSPGALTLKPAGALVDPLNARSHSFQMGPQAAPQW